MWHRGVVLGGASSTSRPFVPGQVERAEPRAEPPACSGLRVSTWWATALSTGEVALCAGTILWTDAPRAGMLAGAAVPQLPKDFSCPERKKVEQPQEAERRGTTREEMEGDGT